MARSLVIVEDDRELRELLAESLAFEGYEVATAANGIEAIDRVNARRPDLVISDIRMPLCDGIELARRLSVMQPPVPLLLLSGYAGSDDLSGLLQDPERVRFLPKPIGMDGLLGAIQAFLGGRAPVARG